MNTPIFDFVQSYNKKNVARFHMPGHKGKTFLGPESLDITEIDGADVLYTSDGIIEESQKNASSLFCTKKTIYSCEGSSLSIRAMLYLALLNSSSSRTVLAARNVHKVFMSAAVLLGLKVEWLYSEESTVLSCKISAEALDKKLSETEEKPLAFYITSPDYLGNVADIKSLADVCHKWGVLLLVDNAHGAYMNFLPVSRHPIALGADMCCDSAHKTLPVLTGGAYLHISKNAPDSLAENAKRAMATFASTSPSYLIMQSLDLANKYISDGYREKLLKCTKKVQEIKEKLSDKGFTLVGSEELKLTVATKSFGYNGFEVADLLLENNIVCEFSDPDFLVLMITPETSEDELLHLENVLLGIQRKNALTDLPPTPSPLECAMSPREAAFSKWQTIPVDMAVGEVLASENVSCPPAIPIAVCGERLDENTIKLFKYYGINKITVVKL